MKHKLFTLLLAVAASVGTMFAQSGTCGDNLTWNLTNGVLIITGTGDMTSYFSNHSDCPWYSYRSSIQFVVIGNGVTSISSFAFYQCSALTSVTIPNSVTRIGTQAFSYCSSLVSVTIPNSVTSIEYAAFTNCSSLSYISIPSSVTSIGNFPFSNCTSLTSINVENGNPNYISQDGVLFNKSKTILIQYPTGKTASSYVIPNSVTSIGIAAFEGCSALTYVTIPNSVTSIGNGAFEGCSALTSVTIPNSVTSIGSHAFYQCSGLTSLTISNSIISIGDYAFAYCSGLTSVTIPNSVTSIGTDAFWECDGLTSINVENGNPNYISQDGVLFNKSKTTLIQYPAGKTASSYVIPNSVTSIGSRSFYKCIGLTSVAIPNSVTSIGSSAFCKCDGLTSMTIPNSVTSIGSYAFYQCSGLTSVTIGNSVTSIGEIAFWGCSSLTSVTNYATTPQTITTNVFGSVNISACTLYVPAESLAAYRTADVWKNFGTIQAIGGDTPCTPISGTCGGNLTWELSCDSVLTISGTGAMADFTSTSDIPWYEHRDAIKSVIIGDDITSIGKGAFYNCSGLTSVTIGNSVASIKQGAFQNCIGLTSVTIPNSVTNIEYGAFKGCSVLRSVTIGNSVTSIGDYAFEYCSSLTSVEIPNSVTSIGYGAFGNCSGLASVTIDKNLASIGNFAFYNCSSLISVTNYATTPQTITTNVFGSVNISSCTLYVPAGSLAAYRTADVWKEFGTILAIGGDTPCTPISGTCGGNLTWELSCDSILTIRGTGAMANISSASDIPWYEYRDAIKSIVIGNGVTSIAGNAFQKCPNLTSVTIPNSVTSIGQVAFYECTALTSVAIPNSVKSIGMGAFTYCSSLTSITIPNSVTSIGQAAFGYCTGLKSVTIGSGITSIEHGLFGNCTNLTSVTIPNNVTSIGQVAFIGCTALSSVMIPNSVTSIGMGAFSGCSALTSVTLPHGITSIEQETFESCSSLTSVVIPNNVTSIGDWAFENCTALTSVTIPSSVTSIGDEVFSGCSTLSSVTNYATTPQTIDEYVFDGVNISSCTLHVPAESVTTYKKATVWKNFGAIQAIGGTDVITVILSDVANYIDFQALSISDPDMVNHIVTSIDPYELANGSKLVGRLKSDGIEANNTWKVSSGYNVTIPTPTWEGVDSLTAGTMFRAASGTSIELGAFTTFEEGKLVVYYQPNGDSERGVNITINGENVEGTNLTGSGAKINGIRSAYAGEINLPAGNYEAGDVVIKLITSTSNVFGIRIEKLTMTAPCSSISGTCGGNLSWELSCDSVLTISGTGAMADFNSASDIPWYEYRDAIRSIVIGKGVTSIAGNAFQKCPNLTSVTIPNSITSIGQVAFYECTALTTVKIPSSVTSIGMGAFTYCSGLTSITIPNSVTSLGQAAFGYCTGLKSVTIGSGITSIEHGLFGNCTSLTSVTIPNNVTSIGQVAFIGCTTLSSVMIPNSVTSIGMGAFSGCSALTSVTLPHGITSIEQETFESCSSLTSVVIPNNVTSIGDWAFENCTALTSVTIPSSVTSIGDEVFSGCSTLSSVTNYATTPQTIDEYVFDGVNISSCTLHVPAGSRANYQTADVWKEFGRIVPITTEDVDITATTITASSTTADIKWPKVIGAETYTLEIKKNGELICTLTFDEEGHLISMSFAAPSRNYTSQQTQVAGFSFTITGLESGTTYNYTMTVKDNNGNVLKTESGTFTTIGAEGIEDAQSDQVQSTKILRNGQIFIQRGEKIYTITGQEIQSY